MKYIIASDLHGSEYYLKKLIDICEKQKADKLILLGDIYNHGPRNPLPKDYNPSAVANILNSIKKKLIVIKGNCDSEVDEMISSFSFVSNLVLEYAGKSFFLTHGHKNNIENPCSSEFFAVVYGHFHTGYIKEKDGTYYINTGSLSLPKEDTKNSFVLLNENKLMLMDMDENVIESIEIN